VTPELKKLYEAVTLVKGLLDDPEEGLMMWNKMLREAVIENQAALCSLGATPKMCGIEHTNSVNEI